MCIELPKNTIEYAKTAVRPHFSLRKIKLKYILTGLSRRY